MNGPDANDDVKFDDVDAHHDRRSAVVKGGIATRVGLFVAAAGGLLALSASAMPQTRFSGPGAELFQRAGVDGSIPFGRPEWWWIAAHAWIPLIAAMTLTAVAALLGYRLFAAASVGVAGVMAFYKLISSVQGLIFRGHTADLIQTPAAGAYLLLIGTMALMGGALAVVLDSEAGRLAESASVRSRA